MPQIQIRENISLTGTLKISFPQDCSPTGESTNLVDSGK